MTKELYKYNISGYYFNGDERKYFYEDVYATDNSEAMRMVLGEIMWKESLNNKPVLLDTIHYEVID